MVRLLKKNNKRLRILLLLFVFGQGCLHKGVNDSDESRILEKPGSGYRNKSFAPNKLQSDLYVKKKAIKIVPAEVPNTTGSLFNLNDERNYLFSARGPLTTGRYIDIDIVSTRIDKVEEPKTQNNAEESKAIGSEVEDTLIDSLPSLEPDSSKAKTIKRIKMKIAHRYPNGDVLIATQRKSQSDNDFSEISVQARIPYDRLISGRTLNTEDLTEVVLAENKGSEIIERRSSGWEDEYTLRLSGFNEAKSKSALRLDQQREQLKKIRDQLRNRLVASGKERLQFAKERQDLLKQQEQAKDEIRKLTEKLQEKNNQNAEAAKQPENDGSSNDANNQDAATGSP
ncbi:MAG: hypothetical protein R3B45_02400 [Bdellovibrionota bacterium]